MGFAKLKYIFARILSQKPSAIKHSSVHKTAAVGNGALIVNSSIGGAYVCEHVSNTVCVAKCREVLLTKI